MTASLWTWSELCLVLGVPGTGAASILGLQIDSRLVKAGDLFFALKGDPGSKFTVTDRSDRDGHDFVPAAIEAGAVGVVVSRPHGSVDPSRQLVVPDTLDALWQLAAARRRQLTGPVIAVTGSSGKTTCKTFLQAALGAFASEGSFNNHLGVPLSLARTPVSARPCVYELGMNHPGEIAPLSELVRPNVAVVLNVQSAHAQAFASPAALRSEKLSIYRGLEQSGVLIVEASIDTSELPAALRIVRFGEETATQVQLLGAEGQSAQYRVGDQQVSAQVPGGGRHRALTLAAVLAVLRQLQLPLAPALTLPADLVPAGRGTRSVHQGVELIDDSYNANPASVTAALQELARDPCSAQGRRYALLGEMLELGAAAAQQHAALAEHCEGLDGVALVGDGMQALLRTLPPNRCLGWWSSVQYGAGSDLRKTLLSLLKPGDKLLIKGSNRVFWQHQFVAGLARDLDARHTS